MFLYPNLIFLIRMCMDGLSWGEDVSKITGKALATPTTTGVVVGGLGAPPPGKIILSSFTLF